MIGIPDAMPSQLNPDATTVQLIFSVFKTLTDQEVTVELKNDLSIVGTLKSVDQFLNIKLDNIRVLDEDKHPHMVRSAGEENGPADSELS